MMPLYLILSEIQAKSLDHEIEVTVTYKKYDVSRSVKLNKYTEYDASIISLTLTAAEKWITKTEVKSVQALLHVRCQTSAPIG